MWHNVKAHEIFSPAKQEQVAMLLEMEQLQVTMNTALMATNVRSQQPLMDKCELFDDYKKWPLYQILHSEDNSNDVLGKEHRSTPRATPQM